MTTVDLLPYWGKAQPRDARGPGWHPLVYHALDVAAVGRALVRHVPAFRERLAAVSGLQPADCADWLALMLAWHDVGKFAEGFQSLVPALRTHLGHRRPAVAYKRRHDSVGKQALEDFALEEALDDAIAEHHGDAVDPFDVVDGLVPWIRAVTGHHGAPPDLDRRWDSSSDPLDLQFPRPVRDAVIEWCRQSFALLWGRPLPLDFDRLGDTIEAGQRASWLVAGLAVAADWIGSDQGWFPYHRPELSPADYWHRVACPRAEVAIAQCGIAARPVEAPRGLVELFPYIERPTPLQAFTATVALPAGPQVWLIEEATGGGKTEAALMLAHRLIAAGRAEGVYVALPTMATANAMHRRVEAMYPRLFADGVEPTLVLSHGRAGLAHALAQRAKGVDDDYAADELSATTRSAAWFADHRKAGLLAPIGVGTIDQALLGVLPSKHQSLRLLGLARSVLVVDEVHACDAYMHRLLCTLLTFQAALGGSVVLLSATVAEHTRRALFDAFADGLGAPRAALTPPGFPWVTGLSADGAVEAPLTSRDECRRRVDVRPVGSVEAAMRVVLDAAEAGRCVAWVRNTVDDAIEAAAALAEALGDGRVELFHARFVLGDRLAIERRVLDRFGPDADPAGRRGRVVVATQVIEQSLDLDFDVMVSDLAPIDLLVQRAGRLCRHRRDASGRRTAEDDARGTPTLWVLGPDPDAEVDAGWLRRVLPRMAPVYPDIGVLWRTARWLKAHGGFDLPSDARGLIEAVFGLDARADYPDALADAVMTAEGATMAARSTAQLAALALDPGYCAAGPAWLDEARALTRLGEPTVTLRLVRVEGDRCGPWHADPTLGWSLSEVSVRQARVASEAPGDAARIEAARQAMPDRGRFVCVVPFTVDAAGVGHAEVRDASQRPARLIYHPRTGLGFVRARGDA